MTYYEELGLTPQATPEQIRQAYRTLSRLLHPDQQPDEVVQRVGEAQMKRLNAIYEILSDPLKRREYDFSLRAAPVDPPPPRRARRWTMAVLPACIGIVALAALFGFFRDGSRHETAGLSRAAAPAEPEQPAPLETGSKTARAYKQRTQVHASRAKPAQLPRELPPAPLPETPPVEPPQLVMPAPLAGSVPVIGQRAEARFPPAVRSFAGTWFYARPKVDAPVGGIYPPIFIEVAIAKEKGFLYGKYRARYQVADRAISPEVVFRFQARAGGRTAAFTWSGMGGAKGEGTMELIGEDSLEITWTALELGAQMGLASGTARLIRRQQR